MSSLRILVLPALGRSVITPSHLDQFLAIPQLDWLSASPPAGLPGDAACGDQPSVVGVFVDKGAVQVAHDRLPDGAAVAHHAHLSRGIAAIENAVRWAGGGLLLADCLIEPDISQVDYHSFARAEEMIDA